MNVELLPDVDPSADRPNGLQQPLPDLPTPAQAAAAAVSACSAVEQHFPWIGPLIEAALLCAAEERRPVEVYTKWGGKSSRVGAPEDADEAKHIAYIEHMLRVVHGLYPWLLPLLDASKSTLLVSPGLCSFTVHSRPGMVFDIPDLIPYTRLTPFQAEAGDSVH